MVKDTLNSVFDNIKERTTNPFLGTLIVVWIVHNWKLVYSLFYFDSKLTLAIRLIRIEEYFQKTPFYLNLLYVFVLTIIVLSVTYLFLGLSRFISEFYEKIIIPKIVQFNDNGAIVLKSDYLAQQEIITKLETRLEEERLAKVAAQNERDEADRKRLQIMSSGVQSDLTVDEGKVEDVKSSVEEDEYSFFVRVTDELKEVGASESTDILRKIKNNDSINIYDKVIDILMLEDLITLNTAGGDNYAFYNFNKQGARFLKFWNKVKKSFDE